MVEDLHLFTRSVSEKEREEIVKHRDWGRHAEPVVRADLATISLIPLDALMAEARARFPSWDDRSSSDRWLAPRVHYALRLDRTEAASPDLWAWLSVRFFDYVKWRWGTAEGLVAENRFRGPVNKQSFARLWWGAELLRNGPDYGPVEKAFVFQDFTNSYLHRPIIRCRSLAISLVNLLVPGDVTDGSSNPLSADDVNDLARVLNLVTAGAPPECETGYQRDDFDAYRRWVRAGHGIPSDWDEPPVGPPCSDTTDSSLMGGLAVASRAWGFAHDAAAIRGARSARRRQDRTADRGES